MKYFPFSLLFCLNLFGEVDVQKLLIEGVQNKTEVFEPLEIADLGKATEFSIQLGGTQLEIQEDAIFDGFRFIAPEGAEELDFVWYFTAPARWDGWYLCPVEGDFKRSFSNWLDGDKVYQKLDGADFKERLRVLQSLEAGYFESGKEYVMWFSSGADGKSEAVKGRLRFVKPQEDDWDHPAIEEALGLEPQPAEKQVEGAELSRWRNSLGPGIFQESLCREPSRFGVLEYSTNQAVEGWFFHYDKHLYSCLRNRTFDF